MDHDFWRDRWASGQTAWHEPEPNASLRAHSGALGLEGGRRVLVPLCGKSSDLSYLASLGAEVVGAELVQDAAEQFFAERGLTPTRSTTPSGHVALAYDAVRILVGDFFALTPDDVGEVHAVYDRAALVALAPEQRVAYVSRLAALGPGASALVVTFVHDLPGGPPFSVDRSALTSLFGGSVDFLGDVDILTPGVGLAARGATTVRELTGLTRL